MFEGLSFSLFCLGDRAYGDQFCAAGRKLAIRLLQLGMTSQCEVGYGDDGTANGGVFASLDVWIQKDFLPILVPKTTTSTSTSLPSSSSSTTTTASTKSSLFRITILDQQEAATNKETEQEETLPLEKEEQILPVVEWKKKDFIDSYQEFFSHLGPITAYSYDTNTTMNRRVIQEDQQQQQKKRPPLIGEILCNERITASDWEQETRHIQINIRRRNQTIYNSTTASNSPVSSGTTHATLPYQAGDIASVLPCNLKEDVEALIRVLPKNIQEIVDHTISIEYDTLSSSSPCSSSLDRFTVCKFWPKRCTVRGWLTYCADIHTLPEREDLRALSHYCDTEHHELGNDQRDKLLSLSETSQSALYVDYIIREKRCWADVLYDFDSLRSIGSKLSVEALFTLLSPMRTRDFSIASAPSSSINSLLGNNNNHTSNSNNNNDTNENNNNKYDTQFSDSSFGIDLCVAVVQGTTPLGRSYHGLCSHYLSKLQLAAKRETDPTLVTEVTEETTTTELTTVFPCIQLWVRPGSFRGLPLSIHPNDTDEKSNNCFFESPILCIGAGTGIAPLRSLILEREAIRLLSNTNKKELEEQEKQSQQEQQNDSPASSLPYSDHILIFGSRREDCDFYYKQDWKKLMPDHLHLLTAFSREDPFRRNRYVQHKLREDVGGAFLQQHLLARKGAIYIAGNPDMARAVKEELFELLSNALGKTNDKEGKYVKALFKKLQKLGRFSVEAW